MCKNCKYYVIPGHGTAHRMSSGFIGSLAAGIVIIVLFVSILGAVLLLLFVSRLIYIY